LFSLSLFSSQKVFDFLFSFFLHASRLMFVVVQLTLLNIETTSSSSSDWRRRRRCGKRNIYNKLIKIKVISSETKKRTNWQQILNDDANGWISWTISMRVLNRNDLYTNKLDL
jgi:hypothetical protein